MNNVFEQSLTAADTPVLCQCIRCLREREPLVTVAGLLVPPDRLRMVLCPICGNKRCPHANDHRHACTNSNAPGQKGSAYEHGMVPDSTLLRFEAEQAANWESLLQEVQMALERAVIVRAEQPYQGEPEAGLLLLGTGVYRYLARVSSQRHADFPTKPWSSTQAMVVLTTAISGLKHLARLRGSSQPALAQLGEAAQTQVCQFEIRVRQLLLRAVYHPCSERYTETGR